MQKFTEKVRIAKCCDSLFTKIQEVLRLVVSFGDGNGNKKTVLLLEVVAF